MATDNESLVNSDFAETVSNAPLTAPPVKAKKIPQYFAAIAATLSAFSAGVVLGWTSPIVNTILDGKFHKIPVNTEEMGWVGSLTTIGAFLTCIPTGFVCDLIGRKITLLLLVIPYIGGWLLIIFSNNLYMLYAGRFVVGIAAGACCVAAPMYVSEIAQKEIRGTLGSYFQLMVTAGVLYAYVFGAFIEIQIYTILCGVVPIIFGIIFVFQPESPLYYIKKGNPDKAREALLKLRGINFNVDHELREIEESVKNADQNVGMFRPFLKRSSRRGLLIGVSLMVFQQLSGINAIIFYTSDIFKDAGVNFDPKYATVTVGVCQVLATYISSLLMDRLGRRVLLIGSTFFMSLSMMLLGIFFTLKSHGIVPADELSKFSLVPVIAVVLFVIIFSLGLGPIPWLILGEIFSPEIKGLASSIAGTTNWFLAFLITKLYLQVDKKVGQDSTFFFFASVLLFATAYIYFSVPETKGKSITQIQEELEYYEASLL